jgi:hypothetical protein
MPTWDETVERLGLSKADQEFVIRLVDEKGSRRPAASAPKTRFASSRPAKTVAKRASGQVRKTNNRARATA